MDGLHTAEDVRRANRLEDVMRSYGVHIDFRGFAKCPFHQGDKHGSLKVYKDGKWHCYGCHLYGDVIDFVARMNNCNFQTAFALLGGTSKKLTKAEKIAYAKEQERRERTERRKAYYRERIRKLELINSDLSVRIRYLQGSADDVTESFWNDLKELEEWRLMTHNAIAHTKELLDEKCN